MTHIEARTELARLYDEMIAAELKHEHKRLRELAEKVLRITETLAENGDFSFM